jgi:hypothetical protein
VTKVYINSSSGIGIALDKDNGVLLSYSLMDSGEINRDSEGILTELDEKICDEVAKHFNISPIDYGVKACSESFTMQNS